MNYFNHLTQEFEPQIDVDKVLKRNEELEEENNKLKKLLNNKILLAEDGSIWYKENIDDFFEEEYATSDIDYYKRSAVYELCYQPIEKVVWGNDNCIVVNLLYEADYSYINYKNILKRFLIEKAEKEDWVRDYLIQCGIIKQGE